MAESRRRSAHWILREAIAQYVEREALRQDALRVWESYQQTGLHLTHEEADAWLDEFGSSGDVALYHCDGETIAILAVRHQEEAGY